MPGSRPSRSETRLTVKLSQNRQVVIPKRLCEKLGLRTGDLLDGAIESGRVVLTPQALVDRRLKTAVEDLGAWFLLPPALRAALRRS
jgi:AbrB family looped-hinge helix DNA binding protein